MIYTYKCGELQWTGPPSGEDQAVIGYNIQGFGSINEPLSGTEFVDNVACTNMPRSPFVNIVYRFIGTNGKYCFYGESAFLFVCDSIIYLFFFHRPVLSAVLEC